MTNLLLLPILIPLCAAILALLAWRHTYIQRSISVIGSGGLLVAAVLLFEGVRENGIQAVQVGDWTAPFGITLVADLLSAAMVLLAGIVGVAVTIYSLAVIDRARERFGYHSLVQILLMGVCGAFLTGDLFNLYVWFEVMLMASFVLLALGGERRQLEGAIKYVTLNLISSVIFLAAIGIIYGTAGTLNMADLAIKLRTADNPGLVTSISMLFLIAFGIKAAVFPLFFWLPASYHTPPTPVAALFSGLLTKVGVYAMIRVFTLLFTHDKGYTHNIILIIAACTMVVGVLGAVAQNEIRRILSFHIVSQIGYMIMGLGIFTRTALAGAVFYIVHHIVVKTNLFLIGGAIERFSGSDRLSSLGGLYRSRPLLAIFFLIAALSLAGVPPLSGFWAKLTLIWAGLDSGEYVVSGAAIMVSLLTLFSMSKIWHQAFWKEQPEATEPPSPGGRMGELMAPIAGLAIITLTIGLLAEPVMTVALQAADQLLDPSDYIRVVLGGGP